MSVPVSVSPFWIGVYPEGTRLTPEKQALSLKFAAERHLAPLKHLLLPRTKGFTTLLSELKKKLTAVYDATCAYESSALFLSHAFIYGRFKTTAIHIHLNRTDISDLVKMKNEEEQQRWLYSCWERKDKLLQYYEEHKHFPQQTPTQAATEDNKDHSSDQQSTGAPASQPTVDRYQHLTLIFVIWSLLITLMFSLFFSSRNWGRSKDYNIWLLEKEIE